MIRAGLPAPVALRLRIRARERAREWADRASEFRQGALAAARRRRRAAISLWETVINPGSALASTNVPEVTLSHFEERYQSLIDLVCWSAKEGVKEEGTTRYAELRSWFLQHYDSFRPALAGHLENEDGDTEPHSAGAPAPRDAFESLFSFPDLDSLIHSEAAISRIQRTRCALESYRESSNTLPA